MKSMIVAVLLVPAAASATPTREFAARWQSASRVAKPASGIPTAEQVLARPGVKVVLDEFVAVAGNYRRHILEARAAGRPPGACLPAEIDLTVDAVPPDIRALPLVRQSRDFADSFGAAIDWRYPCVGKATNH